MTGSVFDVQRFSIHDGDGIRTTVFFKGCDMRCLWCHNPESHLRRPQLMFYEENCAGCGECRRVCPNAFSDRCSGRGECVAACRHGARELSGYEAEASELAALCLRDKSYYDFSGGGVTLSGGEPLLQGEFALELLGCLKAEGIRTAVETAANVPWSVFERLLPYIDTLFCDIKGIDPEKHRRNTGVTNDLILENAGKLKERAADLRFRMPYVPGFNDTEVRAVSEFVGEFPLEFMPYHEIGVSKYKRLGLTYEAADAEVPSREEMEELCARTGRSFSDSGI